MDHHQEFGLVIPFEGLKHCIQKSSDCKSQTQYTVLYFEILPLVLF